jgi:hypothetical protein
MSCRLLYDTHMVTIEVGAEKEHFVVHQSFLCAKSPYFEKALSGSFQEALTRFNRLPDVSPVLFRLFVAWLYHGDLGYVPRSESTIDEDFRTLEVTEEDLQENGAHQSTYPSEVNNDTESIDSDDAISDEEVTEPVSVIVIANTSDHHTPTSSESTNEPLSSSTPSYQGEHPDGWPCAVLVKLYVLADRFDVRELRTDSLDTLIRATEDDVSVCRSNIIRYIYLNTPPGSKLRTYVVHLAAFGLAFSEDISVWTTYPAEFLAAVMIKNSRRLPDKQCKTCYGDALEEKFMLAHEIGERNTEQDLPPYATDLCFYHEHLNKEEREACRLRREGPKPAT